MTALPTLPSRLFIVPLAGIALIAVAGCQRQQAPTGETMADAKPVAAVPAATPAPIPAVDEVPKGVLRAYVWQCADGQTLVMRNLLRERAIAIDFHDGTRRLDQTVSGSGARYADALMVFWTKGSTATLERQGAPVVQCEERRADSLREDARARGVVYRALGNEPGWVLEIGPAGRLSWTTNYGQDRYDFEQVQATSEPGGTSVYVAQKEAVSLKATVKAERCVDDGDVEFDHVVTVESGGQTYRGCGTRLNPK
jgi:membrane-bound inhibitor of C-type lysozyme